VLHHNEALELNLVDYRGGVTLAELRALAAFMAHNPAHLQRDTLNIIQPGSDFAAISLAELDTLFAYYTKLFAPLKLQIMRRGAWVCRSAAAQAHLDHWLRGDTRKAMSSTVRAFDTLADAGDWLLLNPAEMALVERGQGFADVARFTAAAPAR
jgi:hypothetical protein